MKCQLCNEEKPLLKKSHIIPNFMYKDLYGTEHKLVLVGLEKLERKGITYSGFFEKNILCANCDNELLSSLECYASSTIFNSGNSKKRQQIKIEDIFGRDGLPSVRYHDLDYSKIKLFLLSILWRAHISTNQFFETVQLGQYAEKIRTMLINKDAGEEDFLETCIVKIKNDGSRPYKALVDFRRTNYENNTFYVFSMNNMMYHFNISPYRKNEIFEKGKVRKDGTMDIALLSGKFAREYYDSFLGRSILMRSNS